MTTHVRMLDEYRIKLTVDLGAYYRCRVYRSRRKVWEGIITPPLYVSTLVGLETPEGIADAAGAALDAARGT
jgi:hypothetical protein